MTKFEKVFNESFKDILKERFESENLIVNFYKEEIFIKLPDIDFGTSITVPETVDDKFLEDKCNTYMNHIIHGITNNDEIKAKYDLHFKRLMTHIYTVFDNLYYEYRNLKKVESENIKED